MEISDTRWIDGWMDGVRVGITMGGILIRINQPRLVP